MPTTRTRQTRGRVNGTGGIAHAAYIYYTWGPFFDAEDYEQGKTKAELKEFWKTHRETILARYLEENRRKGLPGRRPDYFWQEINEARLKIGEEKYWPPWGPTGPPKEPKIIDVMESDFNFLSRLGLLEPWELEAK